MVSIFVPCCFGPFSSGCCSASSFLGSSCFCAFAFSSFFLVLGRSMSPISKYWVLLSSFAVGCRLFSCFSSAYCSSCCLFLASFFSVFVIPGNSRNADAFVFLGGCEASSDVGLFALGFSASGSFSLPLPLRLPCFDLDLCLPSSSFISMTSMGLSFFFLLSGAFSSSASV